MQTVTFYDSMYDGKTSLKPITHLQCKLRLHSESEQLLRTRGLLSKEFKMTPLVCVLTELPQIAFSPQWGPGTTGLVMNPITSIFNENKIGDAIQMFSNERFISIPITNEYSQHVMKESNYITLQLKFRIYADSYNQRYRFMTSTYETWLKYLYFSTSPLIPSTYANYVSNINSAAPEAIEKAATILTNIKEGASAGMDILGGIMDADKAKAKDGAIAFNESLKAISDEVIEAVSKQNVFGHVTYDLEIPRFIHSTKNAETNKVYWIITNFSATPSAQFLRGLYSTKSMTPARPKPLFFDFAVTIQTNQKMSREQLINMLLTSKDYAMKKAPTAPEQP